MLEKPEEQAIYIIQLNEEVGKLKKGLASSNDAIQSLRQENEAIKQLICPQHSQVEFCR